MELVDVVADAQWWSPSFYAMLDCKTSEPPAGLGSVTCTGNTLPEDQSRSALMAVTRMDITERLALDKELPAAIN